MTARTELPATFFVPAVRSNRERDDEPTTEVGQTHRKQGQVPRQYREKAALSSFGVTIFVLGLISVLVTCLAFVPMFWHLGWSELFAGVVCIGIMGSGSLALLYLGRKAMQEGEELDAGIPFTRANTADLPPADSLVRASDEPVQQQKSVLLRAAIPGPKTRPEELVRATLGPQDTSGPGTA